MTGKFQILAEQWTQERNDYIIEAQGLSPFNVEDSQKLSSIYSEISSLNIKIELMLEKSDRIKSNR